jgi:hypothetical protein
MSDETGRERPKYLRAKQAGVGGGAPDNDTAPAFTVSRGELRGLVRAAVAEAVGAGAAPTPALLDREGLAFELGCSSGFVDKLRRSGMPCLRLGDSPRFELGACLSWLRKDGAA